MLSIGLLFMLGECKEGLEHLESVGSYMLLGATFGFEGLFPVNATVNYTWNLYKEMYIILYIACA